MITEGDIYRLCLKAIHFGLNPTSQLCINIYEMALDEMIEKLKKLQENQDVKTNG